MKFYGAGYAPLGYLKDSVPEAHRRNVAHRISKSAHQVSKLRKTASDTHIRRALNAAEACYPVGTLVDYHGSITSCHDVVFEIIARHYQGPDDWSASPYRYIIREVDDILELRGVREESISLHV